MSRIAFEELLDELSASLMRIDFGTPESLRDAHTRVFEIVKVLEECQRPTLITPAKKVLSALEEQLHKPSPSRRRRETTSRLLEQLCQVWYDAIGSWNSTSGPRDHGGTLELPEVADQALLGDYIANARLLADDFLTQIEEIRAGSTEALSTLRRSIHTLKGEAGMLNLASLTLVLHAAESYFERPETSWDRADHIQALRDWMLQALNHYEQHRLPTVPDDLIERFEQGSHDSPANSRRLAESPSDPALGVTATVETASCTPVSAERWDAEELELLAEFLHESDEATTLIDQTLLDIEQFGPGADSVNKLFRAFHSLKGVASFLRMEQIVALTHTTETMLDRVRSGQLEAGTGVIDLVFDATTMLRELLLAVQTASGQGTPLSRVSGASELIDRIESAIAGRVPEGSTLSAQDGNKLGEILVTNGALTDSQLDFALNRQKETGRKLGQELVADKIVPAKVVAQALRGQGAAAQQIKAKELVKVDLERVDNLVETIGELVIVESMVSNAPEFRSLPGYLRNYLGQFAKITRELQELGMRMRMVPLRTEFQKMARMVRDLTHRSNKRVRVELRGEQTEMDRSMVEQIADPLVHLIRNAVDHGVEPPEERFTRGKPETATVVLSACHEGGSIVIEISDDGRGIDREHVIAKAVAQGLVHENANLSDAQVYDLLFTPGFSTAKQVTEISGRGVGMDVVKRNLEAIRGRIITRSTPGRGTSFRLVLPLTLAIIDGMVIRSGNERFIVPTLNIIESLQPTSSMLFSVAGRSEHILVRGQSLPLLRLGDILGVDNQEQDPTKALVIIVESLRARVALLVDEVVMKHQVVIRTLSEGLGVSNLFAGAAILSNGRVGLILNIEELVGSALACNSPIADVA